MASIRKTKENYSLQIRRKNFCLSKTFKTLEDAKLYEFYKERLLDNMEAFEVPLEQRLTFEHLFDLKISASSHLDRRSIADLKKSLEDISLYFKENIYPSKLSLKDWEEYSDFLINSDVYRGAKTDNGKRKMSLKTWRRIFAVISSVFSHARSEGIRLENHPLTVIQTIINPMLKKTQDS